MKNKCKRLVVVLILMCIMLVIPTTVSTAANSSKLKAPVITLSNVQSTGKLKLTWKTVKNAKSYEVYRSLNKKKWELISTTKKTSVTDTSAKAGKSYYYRVKAIAAKKANNSAYSTVKSRFCKLARPTISLSTVKNTGKTKVVWKQVSGAAKYSVYRSTDNKKWTLMVTTKNLNVTHKKATEAETYYYKVRAIASNSGANSADSAVKSRACRYGMESNLTKYQRETVNFAMEIADEWKTVYVRSARGEKKNGKVAFDCSGFATYVINTVMEKDVPTYRLTASLTKLPEVEAVFNGGLNGEFKAKKIVKKNLQPGDVVFFSLDDKSQDHCGIYIGNNRFVHCAGAYNGVLISEIEGYYAKEYSTARRFLPAKVTAANKVVTFKKNGYFYAKRDTDSANLLSETELIREGTKVTVLYTGNSPERYNCAYIELKDGRKGYIYTGCYK